MAAAACAETDMPGCFICKAESRGGTGLQGALKNKTKQKPNPLLLLRLNSDGVPPSKLLRTLGSKGEGRDAGAGAGCVDVLIPAWVRQDTSFSSDS